MVSSGLEYRTAVAPERLATHLGTALLLFCGCLWVGLDAWNGRGPGGRASPCRAWALGACPPCSPWRIVQSLLGALVAGVARGADRRRLAQ